MGKITNYFKESLAELKKVTWPTKQQAITLTIIVLIVCVILAAFLAVLDYAFNLGIKEIIDLAR